MTIDNELKACADTALRNAYFHELKALVAKYREAAAGLGTGMDTGQAQVEMHTWGENVDGTLAEHDALIVWTDCGAYDTIIEALQDERAKYVYLEGKVVFIKKGGEWFVAPDEEK